MEEIEAVIAVYGVPNLNGEILTEQAALQLFDQLRQQETIQIDGSGYHLVSTRIEGDRNTGQVYARFRKVSK